MYICIYVYIYMYTYIYTYLYSILPYLDILAQWSDPVGTRQLRLCANRSADTRPFLIQAMCFEWRMLAVMRAREPDNNHNTQAPVSNPNPAQQFGFTIYIPPIARHLGLQRLEFGLRLHNFGNPLVPLNMSPLYFSCNALWFFMSFEVF